VQPLSPTTQQRATYAQPASTIMESASIGFTRPAGIGLVERTIPSGSNLLNISQTRTNPNNLLAGGHIIQERVVDFNELLTSGRLTEEGVNFSAAPRVATAPIRAPLENATAGNEYDTTGYDANETQLTNYEFPQRTKVYESHHLESQMWDDWQPRPDDIIIVTAYKSGTTWVQQIVSQLIFEGQDPPAPVPDLSPWVDLRVPPREVKMPMIEEQTNRRFLKTHLPSDCMPFSPDVKYIYVGREGKDCFMSLCNHYATANDTWYNALNETPGLVGPPVPDWVQEGFTPATLFDLWICNGWETLPWETDGWPFWSLFTNFDSWWQYRHLPNIYFVHFAKLKTDLAGEMRRLASFLEIPINEQAFPEQVRKCTFEYMKANADSVTPLGGALWEGGGNSFIHEGNNNKWQGVLSEEQVAIYEEVARAKLTPDAKKWLDTGDGDF